MTTYILFLRGINVGGKNKISMTELKLYLEEAGFKNATTYIQSGNVIVQSELSPKELSHKIETLLLAKFTLDSSIIKVLALTYNQFKAIINNKPKGFGEQPDTYHSDAILLMDSDINITEAMSIFSPREDVDTIWPGEGVIYSQRVSALRTKSRLNKIVGTPIYKTMTIRSWNTMIKLLNLVKSIQK